MSDTSLTESVTAKSQGLTLCHTCHKLQPMPAHDEHSIAHCVRCDEPLHYRKPNSLANTWALLFTGIACLIPAQIWPVMTVGVLGETSGDSLIEGVVLLMQLGSYLVAAVVFIASIFIPISKVVAMIIILLSVQYRWDMSRKQRIIMYRILEFIGRWSMLDIFVVAIMAALVNLGGLAKISAGVGATAFALSVVFTMIAAMSFDPRLIWDGDEDRSK